MELRRGEGKDGVRGCVKRVGKIHGWVAYLEFWQPKFLNFMKQ